MKSTNSEILCGFLILGASFHSDLQVARAGSRLKFTVVISVPDVEPFLTCVRLGSRSEFAYNTETPAIRNCVQITWEAMTALLTQTSFVFEGRANFYRVCVEFVPNSGPFSAEFMSSLLTNDIYMAQA